MNRTNNIHQLRQELSQLMGSLEETPGNIESIKKISQQLGRVVSNMNGLKKQAQSVK